MRYGWLVVLILLGLIVAPPVQAGPPKIGDSTGSWSSGKSFWKLPSWPWSKKNTAKTVSKKSASSSEPSFIRATRNGLNSVWTGTKRATSSAWETTKYVLRPYDPPAPTKKTAVRKPTNDQGDGFWASLFGPSTQPNKPETVNDFLKQPTPY